MEYVEADKRYVEALFEATLDAIQASGRQPTPWQSECLLEAIAAMAVESWTLAQTQIVRSGLDRTSDKTRAGVTIGSLRIAFAESKERRPRPTPSSQPQW